MTNTPACTTCGRSIEPDGPHGLCASCLLKLILDDESVGNQPGKASFQAPLLNIPGYEVREELARGGMGIVYRAVQLEPRRDVALKMLLPHRVSSPGMLERFRLEARAIAALEHPAILPVHHVGEHNGLPFFTMKLATGGTLAQRKGIFAQNWRTIAELVVMLADAVQFAHERGVLHRDLKPGNVLFDEAGRVYVSDFGLAKVIGTDTDLTRSVELLGTPHYLAPEVAARSAKDATTASDIYSLGAILYELIAGHPPFEAEGVPALLKKIVEDEPAPPSTVKSGIRDPKSETRTESNSMASTWPSGSGFHSGFGVRISDLDIICLKCLAKEPAGRYATARELAQDLGRFLRDEPIHARPVRSAEKLWRWSRRNPALALSLTASVLVFALGFAGVVTQWRRAERNGNELRQNLYAADMKLAHLALEHGNLGRAVELVEAHFPKPGEEDLRGFEWRFLWQLCQGDEAATLRGHQHAVSCLAFSPDGMTLATGSYDKTVKIWNLSTHDTVVTLTGFKRLLFGGLAFSPDGQWLAVKDHQAVFLFDTVHWQKRHHLTCPPSGTLADAVAFSPDARTLVAGSSQGIQLWDTTRWNPRQVGAKGPNDIRSLAFSADSALLTTTDGTKLTLWDLNATTIRTHLTNRFKAGWSLSISPTDSILAAGSSAGEVEVWDRQNRRAVNFWKAHALFSVGLAFSPDGKVLATGGGDQLIRLWDAASLQPRTEEPVFDHRLHSPTEIATLRGHSDQVWCLAYAPDGRTLASGSQDGTAKLWRSEPKPTTRSASNLVGQLWFSPDGKAAATLTEDFMLHQFDVASMQETNTIVLALDPANITSHTVSPDGTRLALTPRDGSFQIWDAWTGRGLTTNQLNLGRVGKIALSRDNQSLAVEGLGGDIVEVWDLPSRKKRFVCDDAGPPMILVQNARCLVSPGAGFTIKVWDTFARRQLATLRGHRRWITALAVSPDERFIASGSIDSTARLWDLQTGREIAVLKGHLAGVESVAFSPDGRTLATGGYDATLRLWSVATHKELVMLKDSNPAVAPVQFSPDGNTLAAASAGGDAEVRKSRWRLWQVPSFHEIGAVERGKVPSPQPDAGF